MVKSINLEPQLLVYFQTVAPQSSGRVALDMSFNPSLFLPVNGDNNSYHHRAIVRMHNNLCN